MNNKVQINQYKPNFENFPELVPRNGNLKPTQTQNVVENVPRNDERIVLPAIQNANVEPEPEAEYEIEEPEQDDISDDDIKKMINQSEQKQRKQPKAKGLFISEGTSQTKEKPNNGFMNNIFMISAGILGLGLFLNIKK